MRKVLIAGLIITFLVAGIVVLVPWKKGLEWQIVSALQTRGFSDVSLSVSGLGWHSIVLDDIAFGGENAVRLKNVKVDYSFAGLRSHRLETLTILAPTFVIRQQGAGWVILGLENIKPASSSAPINVASLNVMINKIPFDRVIVEKGEVRIETDTWNLLLPLNVTFDKTPHKISYKSNAAGFRKGTIEAKAGEIVSNVHFEESSQTWEGDWRTDQVSIEGIATSVPALAGSGTLRAKEDTVNLAGSLQSKDQLYALQFRYEQSLNNKTASIFTLASGAMPWKEGRLKVDDVKIPLGQNRPLNFSIQVENVSIDELLGAMTGQRVTATGYVSGIIPITVSEKGDLIFGKGQLTATGPGMISMPPDAIPGDNKQVVLARDILADLNYTGLSISLNNDSQGDLGVTMNVEGRNPAVYNGRDVKLNVNLTGDVLDFIKQNAILFTKPQNLWEHDANKQ